MKILGKLDYCSHIQMITLILSKSYPIYYTVRGGVTKKKRENLGQFPN